MIDLKDPPVVLPPNGQLIRFVFSELIAQAQVGLTTDPSQVVGQFRKIAEIAVAAIPLHAAVEGVPAPRLEIREVGQPRDPDGFGFGAASGGTAAPGSSLGIFNTLAESVGQDFMQEIVGFLRAWASGKTEPRAGKPPRAAPRPREIVVWYGDPNLEGDFLPLTVWPLVSLLPPDAPRPGIVVSEGNPRYPAGTQVEYTTDPETGEHRLVVL